MANLEIEGILKKKLAVQSGTSARGEWAKQEFLVEYQEGKFSSLVVFSVWGQDKVNELSTLSAGEKVKVSFNISSREYAGKYYTDLRAWKITRLEDKPQMEAPASYYQAPAPDVEDMPFDGGDDNDLPF